MDGVRLAQISNAAGAGFKCKKLVGMSHDNHNNEQEWVTLLMQGDQKAFEAIYREYAADLYRYARRNIAVSEDCEEIIQELFESLWRRREALGHVTALRAYLFRIVKYKVIRYIRHSKVKERYVEHYKFFEAVYESMSEEDRDPAVLQAMIRKSLSQLPERCQLAVNLRLTENLSNTDIALRMNIKKRTVENYMVAALAHLRASCRDLYKQHLPNPQSSPASD